jgi:hypothetical protein
MLERRLLEDVHAVDHVAVVVALYVVDRQHTRHLFILSDRPQGVQTRVRTSMVLRTDAPSPAAAAAAAATSSNMMITLRADADAAASSMGALLANDRSLYLVLRR